jgi:hypothetical protein
MNGGLVKEGGDHGEQEYDDEHAGYLEAMEEVFAHYENAMVLDATRDDSATVEAELARFKAEMQSVDLLRQLALLERDMPAERQSDALWIVRHPFCESSEMFVPDGTLPVESANLRCSAPDASDWLLNLVDELVLTSTAARGGASRGTQSRRAAAPRSAPGVPAISHKYNVMSAGACLQRALYTYRSHP